MCLLVCLYPLKVQACCPGHTVIWLVCLGQLISILVRETRRHGALNLPVGHGDITCDCLCLLVCLYPLKVQACCPGHTVIWLVCLGQLISILVRETRRHGALNLPVGHGDITCDCLCLLVCLYPLKVQACCPGHTVIWLVCLGQLISILVRETRRHGALNLPVGHGDITCDCLCLLVCLYPLKVQACCPGHTVIWLVCLGQLISILVRETRRHGALNLPVGHGDITCDCLCLLVCLYPLKVQACCPGHTVIWLVCLGQLISILVRETRRHGALNLPVGHGDITCDCLCLLVCLYPLKVQACCPGHTVIWLVCLGQLISILVRETRRHGALNLPVGHGDITCDCLCLLVCLYPLKVQACCPGHTVIWLVCLGQLISILVRETRRHGAVNLPVGHDDITCDCLRLLV